MRPALVALALVLALALPTVAAHVARPWPNIQSSQPFRTVDVTLSGTKATIGLILSSDPSRHSILTDVDPSSIWRTEYRLDPPDPATAFAASWNWTRFLEYKDVNSDGAFDPDFDQVVRAWRLSSYLWNVTPVTTATVDRIEVQTFTWDGQVIGGPRLRLQLAVAGRDFADEGARVRPQDVMLYLDVLDIPKRGTGNLHAFEGTMTFPAGADWGLYSSEGYHSAFIASSEDPARQAHFAWGGTAVIDGVESPVGGALDDLTEAGDVATSAWRLNMPIAERAMRFVFALGIEFVPENKRAPDVGALVLVSIALAGLLARRSERG